MKKLISFAVAASFCVVPPTFAQLPVTITSNVPGSLEHIETIAKLKLQLDQLKQQYDAITGSYQRGVIGLSNAIKSASVVPGSWQEVVSRQNSGAFGASQSTYEKLIKTLPQELFQDPKGQSATTYKLSTDSVRAALTGGEALYAQVQTNLNNLAAMARQVDSTANTKDAADLQNRIATENGMLQSAMAKLNVMNMNLQANMLNQQNQATAINQQRYNRSK